MATRLLKYDDFVFPAGFKVIEDQQLRLLPAAKLPRKDGGRIARGYLESKTVRVRGGFYRGPLNLSLVVRDKLDDLRDAIAGGPARLWLYDDRYLRCVEGTIRDTYQDTGFNRFVDVDIEFVTGDPFFYSSSDLTDTWTSPTTGATRTVTIGGNAYALPEFRITVGGSGAVTINYTLTNNTTSESFTLSGSVTGGDVILVNSLTKTVKILTTDKITLFDGLFPKLNVGGNSLQITITTGTITQIVTAYTARYW